MDTTICGNIIASMAQGSMPFSFASISTKSPISSYYSFKKNRHNMFRCESVVMKVVFNIKEEYNRAQ